MQRRPHPAILFAVVIVFVSYALPCRATVLRFVRFDEKVDNAAAIILGTCIRNESRWTPDEQRILTYSTVRVEKTLKGSPAQEITVVLPGGTVGGVRQIFLGVPELREGVEYIAFIRNTSVGPTVLFFNQGLYEVRKDSRGEREVIPKSLQGVLMDTQRGVAVLTEEPSALRTFEDKVRESIKHREALKMEMINQKRDEASLWNVIQRNKLLVLLALLGIVLSIWMLFRR